MQLFCALSRDYKEEYADPAAAFFAVRQRGTKNACSRFQDALSRRVPYTVDSLFSSVAFPLHASFHGAVVSRCIVSFL